MKERDRPVSSDELLMPGGLGNPFGMTGGDGGTVTVDYGVYREDLPVGGRSVGEIRRTVGPRYDIGPRAAATINGQPAGEDTVVQAGQTLRFMNLAGEKGMSEPSLESLFSEFSTIPHGHPDLDAMRRQLRRRRKPPKVTIEGEVASVTSPEGRTTAIGLDRLLAQLERGGPRVKDTRDLMLPDGVKWIMTRGAHTIFVHQTPPTVHNLSWIAADSGARHGPGTTYRQVAIALPYLIVFAVFEPFRGGTLRLGGGNECFFRTEPLQSPDDELCYPALLNCSKMQGPRRPLSWICSQKLKHTKLPRDAGVNDRVRQGMADLKRCLLETGFNYSSDDHEESSWFTETTKVDSRVSTIERWEEATKEDPMFVFDVPWLKVGKSVREVADHMLNLCAGPAEQSRTSFDVARLVCAHGEVRKEDSEESGS